MCVLKTFPSPPGDEELINDDIWYCPKHNCAICFSLENTSCPLRSLTLPSQWSGSNSLPTQKMLTSCNSCPFSVCSECESDISNNGSLFQSKRFSADTKVNYHLKFILKSYLLQFYFFPYRYLLPQHV